MSGINFFGLLSRKQKNHILSICGTPLYRAQDGCVYDLAVIYIQAKNIFSGKIRNPAPCEPPEMQAISDRFLEMMK